MEYSQITKQVIDFQKMSFANLCNAMNMAQEQASSAVDMVLEQNTWMPEQGRQALQNWINVCQTESGRFQSYVEEGFAGLEKILGQNKKAAPAKPQK